MLQILDINSFQSVKHLRILLKRITTIVGPSDAGKSAILRALGWVMLNRPDGTAFVKDGSKLCVVKLKVDGKWVVRKRGKGTNEYKLGKARRVAMGRGKVPEDIHRLLNVDDTNFQNQIEPPFWVTETGGKLSKKLNQIVNLGQIDSSLAEAASQLRSAKASYDVTKDRLRQAKEAKAKLAFVEEFQRDVEQLARAEQNLRSIAFKRSALTRSLRQATRLRRARDNASGAIVDAKKLMAEYAEYRKVTSRAQELGQVIREAKKVERLAKKRITDLDELLKVRKWADKVAEDCRNFELFLDEVLTAEKDLCEHQEKAKKVNEELASKTKGRCPLCRAKTSKGFSLLRSPTSTSQTTHRCPGKKKTPGKTSSSTTSPRCGKYAKKPSVPF